VVDLLPAALRMNAFNVAIPRLTCSDAQRPGWLEVYLSDDISCLLHPKSIMLQPRSRFGPKALRCAIVESCSGATQLGHYTPLGYGTKWLAPQRIRLTKNQCGPGDRRTPRPEGRCGAAAAGSGPTPPAGQMHCATASLGLSASIGTSNVIGVSNATAARHDGGREPTTIGAIVGGKSLYPPPAALSPCGAIWWCCSSTGFKLS
jgi:hypothetical protein